MTSANQAPSSIQWYVVHTQPNGEARADANLRRQGFHTYLPRYARSRRHARKTEIIARPLFPRYIFVALDLARDRWYAIRSTFGVSNIVLRNDVPAPVPEGIVNEIQARENESGLITLGIPAGLGPGSPVRLTEGIFADAQGILEKITDDRRVSILLHFLGREVRAFVPAASVGAI